MSEIEIYIGRGVEGAYDLRVPDEFKLVSRKHAKISLIDESIRITDLDSSNGTFINGCQISSCEINIKDDIFLGSKIKNIAYKIDLKSLEFLFQKIRNENKTDFYNEFESLRKVYIEFIEKRNKLTISTQKKSQIPKLITSILIGISLLVAHICNLIPADYQSYSYPIIMIIMAIIGGSSFFGNKNNVNEALIDLELEYQKKYSCPKCGKQFSINQFHWKKLKENKLCPFNCGAQFSK